MRRKENELHCLLVLDRRPISFISRGRVRRLSSVPLSFKMLYRKLKYLFASEGHLSWRNMFRSSHVLDYCSRPTRSCFDLPELTDDQQQSLLALGFLTVNITSAAIIITSTEQLIAFNKHHVGDGENEWTFGQILALLLLVPSLSQVAGRRWTAIRGDGDSSTAAPEDERGGKATPVGMQVTKDGETADAQRTESKEVAGSQAASSNTRHFIGIERGARSNYVLWDDDCQR